MTAEQIARKLTASQRSFVADLERHCIENYPPLRAVTSLGLAVVARVDFGTAKLEWTPLGLEVADLLARRLRGEWQ